MTRRTLFSALLAPFAPKPKLPSLTCAGPMRFNCIPVIESAWMPKNEIFFVNLKGLWKIDGRRHARISNLTPPRIA